MKFAVGSVVNRFDILERNLMRSPMIQEGSVPLHIESNASSASIAFENLLDRTSYPVVVFAHQDVYFPKGWDTNLRNFIEQLDNQEIDWGVIGVFGISEDGLIQGRIWSSGLQREIRRPVVPGAAAVSLDEVVLVFNRDSHVNFDTKLPGFHFYGTDIVQSMLDRGFKALIFENPIVHNSAPVRRYRKDFWQAYSYMQRKWNERLPLPTCTIEIANQDPSPLFENLRLVRNRILRRRIFASQVDSNRKSHELGYE